MVRSEQGRFHDDSRQLSQGKIACPRVLINGAPGLQKSSRYLFIIFFFTLVIINAVISWW